jgi:hypothetical protein
MALAEKVGLNQRNQEFVEIKRPTFLLVERYDRFMDAKGQRIRIHQEDLPPST